VDRAILSGLIKPCSVFDIVQNCPYLCYPHSSENVARCASQRMIVKPHADAWGNQGSHDDDNDPHSDDQFEQCDSALIFPEL
jgi:hypothetical protein